MIQHDDAIRLLCENGAVDPYIPAHVQPSSIDLTLHGHVKLLNAQSWDVVIDPLKGIPEEQFESVEHDGPFMLNPGDFMLARTVERLRIPRNMVGRLEGKSSLGRCGLLVHLTAGYFDPGFDGTATLELANLTRRTIILTPGMRICQMSFEMMHGRARVPYGAEGLGSKYQGQEDPTVAKAAL